MQTHGEHAPSSRLIQIMTKAPETQALTLDVGAMERELRDWIKGEVRFGAVDRGMYASDAGNYRMVPVVGVLPTDAEDVLTGLAVCRRHGAPIVSRGGGTGIPGQTFNSAVVWDFSKYMNRLVDPNPPARYARVQPGIVLDDLRRAAKAHGLTFGPDPATHDRNTLGGMIGNNSCGIHSMMAGETVDNIEELDVVLYDGTRMTVGATSDTELEQIIANGGRKGHIYRRLRALRDRYADEIRRGFPMIPRRVSGFNLPALLPEQGFNVAKALVGTEGTCVVVVEARTTLVDNPAVCSLLVFGCDDIFEAADLVVPIAAFGPIGLEALDDTFIDYMKKKGLHPPNLEMLPDGHAWLLIEFGGRNKAEADTRARRCMDDFQGRPHAPRMRLFDDPAQEKLVWNLREEG